MANISRSEINRRIGKLNKDERKQILQIMLGIQHDEHIPQEVFELAVLVMAEQESETWVPDELDPKTWNLQSADN